MNLIFLNCVLEIVLITTLTRKDFITSLNLSISFLGSSNETSKVLHHLDSG